MLAGSHPRQRTIGAIVEDPDYHARLLAWLRSYRRDPAALPPVREQALRADPHFAAAERAFATLPGYLTYSARLPRDLPSLWRRLRSLERFPLEAPAR
jgi:hypothetical protein